MLYNHRQKLRFEGEKMIIHQLYNSQGNYHYNAYIYTDTSWFAHFHACYELVYAKRNFAVITVNGTQYILEEGELDNSVCAENALTASDGKKYITKFYNLI